MMRVFVLLFLISVSANAASLNGCIQQLKKNCEGRIFSSAVFRCSWVTEAKSCEKIYSLLFKYELKKLEDKQINECAKLPDCREYDSATFHLNRRTRFQALQSDMKKAGFSKAQLDQEISRF